MTATVALLLALVLFAPVARAQTPAPAGGPSTLRVTVIDPTDAALPTSRRSRSPTRAEPSAPAPVDAQAWPCSRTCSRVRIR